MADARAPTIVIAGCGFGGMASALGLARRLRSRARIIAIDKTDRFDYHASLPELVSGKIPETEITIPYAPIFGRAGIEFVQAEITQIDRKKRRVKTAKKSFAYDYLVMALGSETDFCGVPGARENCFEFKSDIDALAIRTHVETMFESCPLDGTKSGHTRIVVVGGGLTGVELVTDLKDLLHKVCARCSILEEKREIVLAGRSRHLSPGFSEEAGKITEQYLRRQGITLVLGNPVVGVGKDEVLLKDGRKLKAKTIVWCAGVRPSRLAEQFSSSSPETYSGRCGLVLNRYLQCIAEPRIFAVGDCGYCSAYEVQPMLTAMRAIEQADYAVHNLCCEITGKRERRMSYQPRVFPALISMGRGMGLLSFQGIWTAGRHIAWLKKLTHHMHMLRFRYNWDFLEYFDEAFVSLMEFIYFISVKRK